MRRIPVMLSHFCSVLAGLVPAIHVFRTEAPQEDVDARDERGHYGWGAIRSQRDIL